MPALRKRQTTLRAQLDALDAELHDAETYLKLADTLEGFLTRLNDGLDQLTLEEQQRILRLVVREVLIGGDDDTITIRHSIPSPNGGPNGSYPLRGSSHRRPLRSSAIPFDQAAVLVLQRRLQPPLHVQQNPAQVGVMGYRFENEVVRNAVEKRLQVQV